MNDNSGNRLFARMFLALVAFLMLGLKEKTAESPSPLGKLAAEDGPSMVWGEVPIDQLKMAAFPPDTNAAAIILFDYGNASFDHNYELTFKRHCRIKILTKGGYEFGQQHVDYFASKGTQRVHDVKGTTFSLGPDGQIVKQEMPDESIFKEDLDGGWKRVKFALPSLTPGCIMEYSYEIISRNPHYLPDWSFQTTEPTLWSEFEIKTPTIFDYAAVTQTTFPFFVKTSELIKETFMGTGGAQIIHMAYSRWVMKDVPALREEPYMTTLEDYNASVKFQLSMISWPGEIPIKILESWEKVAEELMDLPGFGKQLKGSGKASEFASNVIQGITNPLSKLEAVYDFVRSTIVWNERRTYLPREDLDRILESKTANSGGINLLLTKMLREVGVQADPVLISTRTNGQIQKVYPIVDQFDYVISRAVVAGKEFFLDATDRLRPFSLLPPRALNHLGFLVKEGGYLWVSIEPTGKDAEQTLVQVALRDDGSFAGTIHKAFSEYGAFSQRKTLAGTTQEKFVKSLLKSESFGVSVDSFSVAQKDTLLAPLIVDALISSTTYAQVLGDFIYVNPMFSDRSMGNPFKLANRSFPVDFAYPRVSDYTLALTVPDGYVLKELPTKCDFRLPHNGAVFTRTAQLTGNVLQLVVHDEVNQITFEPQLYPRLKEFFDKMVALESDQLVFQKSPVTKGAVKSKK